MKRTRMSSRTENMPGWPIDGIPVKRQVGMIYWYSWGKEEFDIRVLRQVLGLPAESTDDKYFMAPDPDPCGAFCNIMAEIFLALENRKFAEVLKVHDRLLDEQAERDRQERIAMKEKMAKLPRIFKAGDLPSLMAQVEAGVDFRKLEQGQLTQQEPKEYIIPEDIPF